MNNSILSLIKRLNSVKKFQLAHLYSFALHGIEVGMNRKFCL